VRSVTEVIAAQNVANRLCGGHTKVFARLLM
jgi:hypothetical protein